MKLDLNDPSPHCDCRSKSIRNVRIIAAFAAVCTFVLGNVVFSDDSAAAAVSVIALGLALVVYGIATMCDETATFPKWLYAILLPVGALYAAAGLAGLL